MADDGDVVVILAVGDLKYKAFSHCVFLVAGSRLCNCLPCYITSSPMCDVFCKCLKTYLSFHVLLPPNAIFSAF